MWVNWLDLICTFFFSKMLTSHKVIHSTVGYGFGRYTGQRAVLYGSRDSPTTYDDLQPNDDSATKWPVLLVMHVPSFISFQAHQVVLAYAPAFWAGISNKFWSCRRRGQVSDIMGTQHQWRFQIYIYIFSCSSLPWGNRSNLTYIFQMGCNHQLVNEDSGKKKTTKRAIAFLQFFTIGNFYANLRLHMGGFLSWNIVPEGRSLGRKVVQLSFPLLHLCICSITMTGRWDLKMVIGGNTTIWDQNQTQATCHVFEHPSLKEDCIVILKEQFKIFKSIFLKKFVRDRYTIIPSPPSS